MIKMEDRIVLLNWTKKRFHLVIFIISLILISHAFTVYAGTADDWKKQPLISEAYEQAQGKIYLEWTGKATFYQVYMDGKLVKVTDVTSTLIDMDKGMHTIRVVPAQKEKGSGIDVGFNAKDLIGINLDIALKETITGIPSDPVSIDYIPDPLQQASLNAPVAEQNADNDVILSFTDRYNADEYLLTLKEGNDTSHLRLLPLDEKHKNNISSTDHKIAIRLDPAYLRENESMGIDLGGKYLFTIQLRKYAVSYINGEKIKTAIHESKASEELKFTPVEAWRSSPTIIVADQSGEGSVKLRWSHGYEDSVNSEYEVALVNKVLGVKSSETVLARTDTKEIEVFDLEDNDYNFVVTPLKDGKKGETSPEAGVKVKNTWNAETSLKTTQVGKNQVKLEWNAAIGVV